MNIHFPIRRLLWTDGFAALIAGILLLSLQSVLSNGLQLPQRLLAIQGGIALCYATYSLTLAPRKHPPVWMIRLLIAGNWTYALAVVLLLFLFFPTCSALGVAYFMADILFVGGLGVLEWVALKDIM